MPIQMLVLAVPISLVWMGVTGQVSLGGFVVGYIIGLLTLLLLKAIGVRFDASFKPGQPLAILTYSGLILWDGLVSSFQVVRLVLSPKITLKTGIVALQTGDKSADQQLSALSAHGINMTPGQLVIDFDESGILYVHCLDIDKARPTLESEQARRSRLLRRIMGVDEK
jgi:multicomponent Na+:H+ antiporter subunit E